MTSKDILEKAIQKAIDGGLSGYWVDRYRMCQELDEMEFLLEDKPIESLIFNHDFAKALWGDEYYHETFIVPKELNESFAGTRHLDVKPMWQYHLQQMVVADDPIKYLEENI